MDNLSLIDLVRRGELSFERLVEVLSDRGYVTEHDRDQKCRLGASLIERAQQEQFDALFEFFYPGRLNDVQLSKLATDRGGPVSGAFSYALFNINVVSRERMHGILVELNKLHQQPL